MKNITQTSFWHYCKDNNTSMVKKYLSNNNDINVLYNDGSCFFHAIKNCNIEMLKLLIDYYIKNVPSNPEDKTLNDHIWINHLKTIIDDIEERIEIPEMVMGILYEYNLLDPDYSESEDKESSSDYEPEEPIEDFFFKTYDNNFPDRSFHVCNSTSDGQENLLNLSGENIITIEG